MFYSASTNGFYDLEIHGYAIPVDAVEIDASHHAMLLEMQSSGKFIRSDENGFPVAVEQPPLTIDQMAANARADRYLKLLQADIAINKAEDSGIDATALRQYRQALRDVTEQAGFPTSIDWPVMP